uniref:FGENESH: predicted gene_6.190 protein n=1 Tax=Rhodotorula toruloides TaxID=5286 RepID=A0A0K3CFR1_RHOTO
MGVPLPSHPSLSEVFTAFEQAVTSFQSTHPDNNDFVRTSTYKRFFPLLRSATPPAWPAVQQVLLEQFGETSTSCRAGVEAGEMGVGLVVDVLARTEVAEDFGAAMAAKLWLVQLESAATKAELELLRRQSATPAAAASPGSNAVAAAAQLPTPSETAQANPFAVPAPTPTPSATSTRPSFGSYTNPSGWKATPVTSSTATNEPRAKSPVFAQQDQHMDDPWKSDDFGPSASGEKSLGENSSAYSRSRSRSQAPPREDTPPKVVKEKTPAPRASTSASTSKRGTPVRSTRARSPKYTPTVDSDSSELAEDTESEGEKKDDQDDDQDDDDDYNDDEHDDMSYRSESDGQATTQAHFLTGFFRPCLLPDISPPLSLAVPASLNRNFSRYQIGGPRIHMVSKGWKQSREGAPYDASQNFIALKPDWNLCGRDIGALGEPVAILARKAKCNEVLNLGLAAQPRLGKQRPGAQDANALPLPFGPGAFDRLHAVARDALGLRCRGKLGTNDQETLRDWGFEGAAGTQITLEMVRAQLNSSTKERTHVMRFLILRCTGFDDESRNIWAAKPLRDPNQKPAETKRKSAGQ